jgi:hypothetical protein
MRAFIEKQVPNASFIESIYDEAIIGVSISSKKVIYSLRKCTEIHKQHFLFVDFDTSYLDFILKCNSEYNKADGNLQIVFCLDFITE